MKITKAVVSISKTVQMRQFEPATVFVSMEAQIDPTDKAETVVANLKKRVRMQVDEEEAALKKERKENYDDEMEKSQ